MRLKFKILIFISLFIVIQMAFAQKEVHQHTVSMEKSASDHLIKIDPVRLQAIGVKSEPVKRLWIEKTIRTVGYIEEDERLITHIHVRFDGWIEKLFVNFTGEKVKKGQPLFTVYSPELVATQQEYLLAMQSKKILSKNNKKSMKLSGETTLESAKKRLLLWGISSKEIDALTKRGHVTSEMTIYSPISGTVTHKMALSGIRIKPEDNLYTIVDLTRLWILADIYEYELPYIQLNQTAEVTLSYMPNHLFKAKLDFIYPTVEKKTRTAKVRFVVDNDKDILKPGMYANVELNIPLGKRLVVPKNAVLLTGERVK